MRSIEATEVLESNFIIYLFLFTICKFIGENNTPEVREGGIVVPNQKKGKMRIAAN
jgi:hypothetical protein